jgi:hypothetical protein
MGAMKEKGFMRGFPALFRMTLAAGALLGGVFLAPAPAEARQDGLEAGVVQVHDHRGPRHGGGHWQHRGGGYGRGDYGRGRGGYWVDPPPRYIPHRPPPPVYYAPPPPRHYYAPPRYHHAPPPGLYFRF